LLLVATIGCGGPGADVTDAQNIPFTDHGSTQQSGYEGGPRVVAASDLGLTGLGRLATPDATRFYLAAFAGSQRTGGYDIRFSRVDRSCDTLTVRAIFTGRPANRQWASRSRRPVGRHRGDHGTHRPARACVGCDLTVPHRQTPRD